MNVFTYSKQIRFCICLVTCLPRTVPVNVNKQLSTTFIASFKYHNQKLKSIFNSTYLDPKPPWQEAATCEASSGHHPPPTLPVVVPASSGSRLALLRPVPSHYTVHFRSLPIHPFTKGIKVLCNFFYQLRLGH